MENYHVHHHHEHAYQLTSLSRVFIISIVLNLLFVIIEAVVGWSENSLGLLSDAGHNLGDVFSLLLALIAFKLSKVHRTQHYTYGYKKSTILISLVNAVLLLGAVGAIVTESIRKLAFIQPVHGEAISWTAGIGILVNGFTAWLLMRNQHDLNVRGAFIHMAADTLVSVGVLLSGLIISFTACYWIDPVISLVVAAVILFSTWQLLSESLRLSLDGIPKHINMEKVKEVLHGDQRVKDVHHVHVWAISTTDVALTAHLVLDKLSDMEPVKDNMKQRLRELGIDHSTLEIESTSSHCPHSCI